MSSFIAKKELMDLGESLVSNFEGPEKYQCAFVNIDQFIADYLSLPVLYFPFAEEDRTKLGFLSDGVTPLWIYKKGQAVQEVFPKNTIVVDSYLLHPEEAGRRAFTVAHEAAHYLLEKHNPPQAAFHREFDADRSYSTWEFRQLLSVNEVQADTLAAALLMPRYKVLHNLDRLNKSRPIPLYGDLLDPAGRRLVHAMANRMHVSYTAMLIQLEQLKLFELRPLEEYLEQLRKPEVCDEDAC